MILGVDAESSKEDTRLLYKFRNRNRESLDSSLNSVVLSMGVQAFPEIIFELQYLNVKLTSPLPTNSSRRLDSSNRKRQMMKNQ